MAELNGASPLQDWLADVLASRNRSSNTVDNYTWAIQKHLLPALGAKRLRSLSADDVDAMLRTKAAVGMSKGSMVHIRSTLLQPLRHAERRGPVARNVPQLMDVPASAHPSAEGSSLTAEEAHRVLAKIKGDRLEALYVSGLMLGLRPGELLGLGWDDIDFETRRLQIRRSLKR